MKYIKNEFFDGLDYADNFEGAKAYFVNGEKDVLADPDFVADSTEEEIKEFKEYVDELEAAENEEELCAILNRETDRYGNGTSYTVKEVDQFDLMDKEYTLSYYCGNAYDYVIADAVDGSVCLFVDVANERLDDERTPLEFLKDLYGNESWDNWDFNEGRVLPGEFDTWVADWDGEKECINERWMEQWNLEKDDDLE